MWNPSYDVPVTSRAAVAELERQRMRMSAPPGERKGRDAPEADPSKGEGRKEPVQPKPEDQRGRPDPKETGR